MSSHMAFDLSTLEKGDRISSLEDDSKSFIVVEVDLLRERVKMYQDNLPKELARWYHLADFLF